MHCMKNASKVRIKADSQMTLCMQMGHTSPQILSDVLKAGKCVKIEWKLITYLILIEHSVGCWVKLGQNKSLIHSSWHTRLDVQRGLWKMKLKEAGRQKSERQKILGKSQHYHLTYARITRKSLCPLGALYRGYLNSPAMVPEGALIFLQWRNHTADNRWSVKFQNGGL